MGGELRKAREGKKSNKENIRKQEFCIRYFRKAVPLSFTLPPHTKSYHNQNSPTDNTDQLTNQIDHHVFRIRENGGPANDILPNESTTNQRRRASIALALGDAHPRTELEALRRQFIDYDRLSWPSMLSPWVDRLAEVRSVS